MDDNKADLRQSLGKDVACWKIYHTTLTPAKSHQHQLLPRDLLSQSRLRPTREQHNPIQEDSNEIL
jgi:hypothetical protein